MSGPLKDKAMENQLNAALARIKVLKADNARLAEMTGASITVGGGLCIYGSIEAVKRVQDYILLSSKHPVEAAGIRRSLMRQLEEAERQRDAAIEALRRYQWNNDGLCPECWCSGYREKAHRPTCSIGRVLAASQPNPETTND